MKYGFLFLVLLASAAPVLGQAAQDSLKLETTFDSAKQQTTVRLPPVKLSGEKDKYHSLRMSPGFKYEGDKPLRPAIIDFELQIVVKGRLRTDLYVLFVPDGEKIFLSSSRWAIMRPIPGRVWMGERLVFRMPYQTLLKIAAAKQLQIKMDAVVFEISEEHLQVIRDFAEKVKTLPMAC